tara:strand:- start:5575 stop:7308 length:1734 start_codon:yes stop_codon:yes gene_type:complete
MANKSIGLLTIAFGADLRGFDKAMKKAQRSIKKFGTSMQRTGQNLTRNLTLPLAAFAAASVKAFDTQAKAETKLLTALKGREDIQKRLIAQAKELQTKTLFGDEETIAAQAMLATMGLEEDAIMRLIPLVQDMATAKGMDLVQAADLVAKSVGSSTNALSRYGITITGAVGSQERLNTATEALNRAFGGQAEAISKVGAGSLVQLKNQFGDLMEEIGEKLMPLILKFANKLKDIVVAFTSLDDNTKNVIVTIGILLGALGPLLLIVGKLTIAFAALFSPSGAILVGILALAAAFVYLTDNYEAFKERLSDWTWWRNALIEAAADFVDILGGRLGGAFGISDSIRELKVDSKDYIHEFGTFADAIKNKAEDLSDVFKNIGKSFGISSVGVSNSNDNGKIPFLSAINPQKFIGPLNQVGKTITELTQKQKEFNAAMSMFENIMSSAMTSAAYSTNGFFKGFIDNIKQSIKQLLVQLAVSLVIKSLFGFDVTKYKTAFEAAKAGVLGLANGGLVTGPTMALVGEGAGTTASNPEVVAPLDKLKGMLNNKGTQQVEVYGRISGNDIFISNQKGGINRLRSV